MSGIATAIVGSAVIGGIASNSAAGKAADAQRDATAAANETQLKMFEQNREDQAPWRKAGEGALGQMVTGTGAGGEFNRNFTMADFLADPGYEFTRGEAMRGIETRAASQGLLRSGGTLADLLRVNSGLASQQFGSAYDRFNNDRTQRFNRLASLAGVGQTAVNATANQGAQVASNIAGNLTSLGNAQGAAAIARGNAVSGASNTLGNFAMNQYFMNQMRPFKTPGYGTGYGNDSPFGAGIDF